MEIGIAIKKTRQLLMPQLNQKACAKRFGISQTYLSQIESGRKAPSFKTLERISDELSTPLSILFWFALEECDISDDKKEYYRFLKPSMDKMVESII